MTFRAVSARQTATVSEGKEIALKKYWVEMKWLSEEIQYFLYAFIIIFSFTGVSSSILNANMCREHFARCFTIVSFAWRTYVEDGANVINL